MLELRALTHELFVYLTKTINWSSREFSRRKTGFLLEFQEGYLDEAVEVEDGGEELGEGERYQEVHGGAQEGSQDCGRRFDLRIKVKRSFQKTNPRKMSTETAAESRPAPPPYGFFMSQDFSAPTPNVVAPNAPAQDM